MAQRVIFRSPAPTPQASKHLPAETSPRRTGDHAAAPIEQHQPVVPTVGAHVADRLAASSLSLFDAVDDAPRRPHNPPLIELPDCRTAGCKEAYRRTALRAADPQIDVLELIDPAVRAAMSEAELRALSRPRELPVRRIGLDYASDAGRWVTPGYEDFAHAKDTTELALALWTNRIVPKCACARALFAIADREIIAGAFLGFLEQQAAMEEAEERK